MLNGCQRTCATCRFWTRQGPQLANAQRDPSCPADEGVCQFAAPVVTMLATGPSGIFPRTHADRWCGQWHLKGGAGGPDDGEHVVVPLRRVA